MLVKHYRQELIHWQHFTQRLGVQQFFSTLQGESVAQCPVGVIRVYQVLHSLYPAFRELHLQSLTAHISDGERKA